MPHSTAIFEGRDAESVLHALRLPILQPIAVNEHDLERLENELRELWHIPEHVEGEPDRIASVRIYELLTCIAAMTYHEEPKQLYRSNAEAEKLLRAAVHYMEQHYMEEISVANIAYTIGYSQQHFQRRFKEMYGMNPSQYLLRLRLLKGAQLLEQEFERTVGEIAEMVGMELNYFVRVFKREYGITPAKYRAMQARHHDPSP
ncbi:AraC family transcriptional regulator [Insulibacter thermoxylanivorax]|nr:AraC family transcriptional regulator [Insulibacter thermoxylanivorax]